MARLVTNANNGIFHFLQMTGSAATFNFVVRNLKGTTVTAPILYLSHVSDGCKLQNSVSKGFGPS